MFVTVNWEVKGIFHSKVETYVVSFETISHVWRLGLFLLKAL